MAHISDSDLLSDQEKFYLQRLKTVATIIGEKAHHREYARRLLTARRMAAQGRTEEARKEYGLIKAKFPELWKMFGVLHNVYSMGFHDGAHRAAMQYYEENQKVEKDQDLE